MFSGQNIGIMVLTVVLNNGEACAVDRIVCHNVVKGRIILLNISLGSPDLLFYCAFKTKWK